MNPKGLHKPWAIGHIQQPENNRDGGYRLPKAPVWCEGATTRKTVMAAIHSGKHDSGCEAPNENNYGNHRLIIAVKHDDHCYSDRYKKVNYDDDCNGDNCEKSLSFTITTAAAAVSSLYSTFWLSAGNMWY